MRMSIWGSEICGLVAAACFARAGNNVRLVIDNPQRGLDSLSQQSLDTEPGLKRILGEQIVEGRISLSAREDALRENLHLLAYRPNEKHKAEELTTALSDIHSGAILLITQSNFGIGACNELQQKLDESANQVGSYVPENLPQGHGIETFESPKSLIFGCENIWALGMLRGLFRPFLQNGNGQITTMTPTEAEFSKFAITGMLALRLSYINELANLADNLDADIEVIRDAMATDPRIGRDYLQPGCGFGGLSFSQYLSGLAETLSAERNSTILMGVLQDNEVQKETPFRKLWRHYEGELNGKTITIWGTSFKPETSSMDNAPSIRIVKALLAQQVSIKIHDPQAIETCRSLFGDGDGLISYETNAYDALKNSHGLLVLTHWKEYWAPDFERMKNLMTCPLVVDGRNLYDRNLIESIGFTYHAIGH